jgi:hypothetical protein
MESGQRVCSAWLQLAAKDVALGHRFIIPLTVAV